MIMIMISITINRSDNKKKTIIINIETIILY